jgi:transporter family protein
MEALKVSKYTPLIIGGLIPALLYGLAGVFQKWSAREGGSVSVYLIGFGVATVIVGVVYRAVLSDGASPTTSVGLALLAGLVFGVGAGLISLALIRFDAAISQLAPLYNMNFLITVLLGLLIFSEFRDLQVPRLLAGALLILVGGWVVSGA